jgi:hypothetical protein
VGGNEVVEKMVPEIERVRVMGNSGGGMGKTKLNSVTNVRGNERFKFESSFINRSLFKFI